MIKPKFKNIIFDCDSTLTKIEGLDEIARRKGKLDQVELITQQGMNGELPYRISFHKRWLEIVRPTKEDLQWLGEFYIHNLTPGVAEVIARLKSEEINIFILSHVPELSIKILADYLDLPKENVFAVPIEFNQDSVMSVPEAFLEIIDNFKDRITREICIDGPTVLVGDGMTDYEAGKSADLFIGFGGVIRREKIKALASVYIEEPGLQPVIDIVLLKEKYA